MADFFYYLCCLCSLVFPLLFTLRITNSWKSRISIIIVVSAHKGLWNEYKKCGRLWGSVLSSYEPWGVGGGRRTEPGDERRYEQNPTDHCYHRGPSSLISSAVRTADSRVLCLADLATDARLQADTSAVCRTTQAPDPTGPPTWKTKQPCPHTETHRSSATFMMIDNADNTNDAQSIV